MYSLTYFILTYSKVSRRSVFPFFNLSDYYATKHLLKVRLCNIAYLTKLVNLTNFCFNPLNVSQVLKSATLGLFATVLMEKTDKNTLILVSWHLCTNVRAFKGL